MNLRRTEKLTYYLALLFVIYMPLHILLSQSLSLATGGLNIWKAAKDVVLCLVVPFLLLLAYKQGAFTQRFFRRFILLGGLYSMLYLAFLIFDQNADRVSVITAAVYNTRFFGYLLLGYVVANSAEGKNYAKKLTKIVLTMCMIVASLGVIQYFLPKDLLTHVGYSLERGVKPMFFIDDKPAFPRVMSTLRDPNSLGAFLVFPIVYASHFLVVKRAKKSDIFSNNWLKVMLAVSLFGLLLTFSRSGLISTIVALLTLIFLVIKDKKALFGKGIIFAGIACLLTFSAAFVFRDTFVVQNLLFHADESTIQADPNELRISFGQSAIDHIVKYPLGEGPGSAGLVAIRNPEGGVLTENYYLQIAYEVGIAGLALFLALLALVLKGLYEDRSSLGLILFSAGLGIAVFGMLNHSWSNESLAFVWWFPAGLVLGGGAIRKTAITKK